MLVMGVNGKVGQAATQIAGARGGRAWEAGAPEGGV